MQIFTPRLLLREFQAEDWRAVLEYQSDPLYLRFYNWSSRSEADVRAFVNMFLAWQAEQPRQRFQLAITLKQGGALIGNVGIRVNDPRLREANIGYEIDSRHWHQGYATEAARAILTFGFGELELHRVYAECVAENEASWHLMERLGMTREAHEREKDWVKGSWRDRLTYAILDHEWKVKQSAR